MPALGVLTLAFLLQQPGAQPRVDSRPSLPAALRHASAARVGAVETLMRNVSYHAGPRAILAVHYLRGRLIPTDSLQPPWLDDPLSFVVAVDTGEMAVSGPSLAALMNDWVMHYQGAPLSRLSAHVRGPNLELKGHLHGLSFRIEAKPGVTREGRVSLTPVGVRVAGVGVRGLMHDLGIELDDVLKVTGRRGLMVSGDTVILAPGDAVPPPRLSGSVVAVRLVGDSLVLVFGRSRRGGAPAIAGVPAQDANCVLYRGGVLRFGKLTMSETDLTILDADPRDPLDLNLQEFNRQLASGSSRNLLSFALVTTLPDFADLKRP